jgi:hypothetical protein
MASAFSNSQKRIQMLKKEITYEDFNGDTVTETFYFNINKTEILELDVEHQEGMEAWIKTVSETNDKKTMLAEFKKIILLAYGQKSPDGKRFIKTPELREEFSQSAAFEALFMSMLTDDGVATSFIIGALPRDLGREAEKRAQEEAKAASAAPAPAELQESNQPSES